MATRVTTLSVALLSAAALLQLEQAECHAAVANSHQLSAAQLSRQSDLSERASAIAELRSQSSGYNFCAFYPNGTRIIALPKGVWPDPCAFTHGMVLRATDSGAPGDSNGSVVWGFSAPGQTVTMAIDNKTAGSTQADATGRWEMAVKMATSTLPHTLAFTGDSSDPPTGAHGELTQELNDVLFGDVFLCSGQSNMDFSVSALNHGHGGCFAYKEVVAAAASGKYDDIRLAPHGRGWGNASTNGGNTTGSFSAVCFLTAVAMKKNIPGYADRPIGLIQASVGGTVIEEWMSTKALEQCLPANESVKGADCAAGSQQNSNLYYGMVAPLAPMALTGTFWYQGESNVAQNWSPANPKWNPAFRDYYACLFKAKVQSWREVFHSPNMFYGFVSLAAYGAADGSPAERTADALNYMRQDQNSVLGLPKTGVALALDIGDDGKTPVTPPSPRHGGIHPRNKTEVGRRLALAYAKYLGHAVVSEGPTFEKVTKAADGKAVLVSFTNTGSQGKAALSPTAECMLHCAGKCAEKITTREQCCSATPRVADSNGVPSDGGIPFELQVANGSSPYYVLPAHTSMGADGATVQLVLPASHSAHDITGVRYSFQAFPYCVLRNQAGLPAMPFVQAVA